MPLGFSLWMKTLDVLHNTKKQLQPTKFCHQQKYEATQQKTTAD
jgi:hypothetical protein